jgi:hypothetical protein
MNKACAPPKMKEKESLGVIPEEKEPKTPQGSENEQRLKEIRSTTEGEEEYTMRSCLKNLSLTKGESPEKGKILEFYSEESGLFEEKGEKLEALSRILEEQESFYSNQGIEKKEREKSFFPEKSAFQPKRRKSRSETKSNKTSFTGSVTDRMMSIDNRSESQFNQSEEDKEKEGETSNEFEKEPERQIVRMETTQSVLHNFEGFRHREIERHKNEKKLNIVPPDSPVRLKTYLENSEISTYPYFVNPENITGKLNSELKKERQKITKQDYNPFK